MKQIVILTVSLIVAATRLAAQEVKGRVIDKDCQRIEGATVVMQTPDSVFVDGVVTDSLGRFIFHRDLKQYRLIFQTRWAMSVWWLWTGRITPWAKWLSVPNALW